MVTIIGIFDNALDARRAMESLRDGPIMIEDISVISKESGAHDRSEDVSAGEGAAVGAVWGGLVGLTALLIPGVGPFIALGALGAALTGAVTGAVVGGISAALIDFSGIPEEDARGYESEVAAGKTLVAVKASETDAAAIHQVLSAGGANSVRDDSAVTGTEMANPPARVMMYDDKGQRVEQAAVKTSARPRGIYDYPLDHAGQSGQSGQSGQTWTAGEVIGAGQGSGPHNTGKFDADQWVGEGQGPGKTTGDTWTSGEFVGEGQGSGPRKDTGEYDSRQWVGEGQGESGATSDDPTKPRI